VCVYFMLLFKVQSQSAFSPTLQHQWPSSIDFASLSPCKFDWSCPC
jgi:hypothetical protein